MPVSVFQPSIERGPAVRVETQVPVRQPRFYLDHTGGEKSVLMVAAAPNDSMAMILRLSAQTLRQKDCLGMTNLENQARLASGLAIVQHGVEVIDFEPKPGETSLLEVMHFNTGIYN